jgi:hypothetical protein
MAVAVSLVVILALAQVQSGGPVKTTVCEIAAHPDTFDGKAVQARALVETGVDDLPSGLTDPSCGGELKFFAPGDAQFARLLKSKGYRKLVKDTKKNPVVEATVTGVFKRFGVDTKPDNRLALESVDNVVVIPQPHQRPQKR